MELDKFEITMLKDALIEHWHNSMKHCKDDKIRVKYKYLMEDIKTIQQTKGKKFILNT